MRAKTVGGWAFVVLAASCGGGGSGNPARDSGAGDAVKSDAAKKDAAHDAPSEAAASTNDWSCLGHVKLAAPAKTTLSLQVEPVDLLTAKGVPNALVQACAADDGPCAKPLTTATTDATTGIATLTVSAGAKGFDGYWQSAPTGYLLTKNVVNIPYRNDAWLDGRQEWTQSEVEIALGSAGASWDMTNKGIVGAQVHDCTSRLLHQDTDVPGARTDLAIGVSLSISPSDPGIVLGYFLGDTLSTTATQTDKSGQGGFVNVPEGFVTVTATLAATGQVIGTVRAYASPGALTGTVIAPDH